MRAYLDQNLALPNNVQQECVDVYYLFKDYLDANINSIGNGYRRTVNKKKLADPARGMDIIDMKENDIMFIKCPTIASYHYLTLIKNNGKCSIFQKFGRAEKIYMINVAPENINQVFKNYFRFIREIKAALPVKRLKSGQIRDPKLESVSPKQLTGYKNVIIPLYKLYKIPNIKFRIIHYAQIGEAFNAAREVVKARNIGNPLAISPEVFNVDKIHVSTTPRSIPVEEEKEEEKEEEGSISETNSTEDYIELLEGGLKMACNDVDDAHFFYTLYKYNDLPVIGAPAIVIPAVRAPQQYSRDGAGVGPRKKFNALRMFKQFAKQHSSEIQSSSSAKFQTKKRKAPQTKKTKRRRK